MGGGRNWNQIDPDRLIAGRRFQAEADLVLPARNVGESALVRGNGVLRALHPGLNPLQAGDIGGEEAVDRPEAQAEIGRVGQGRRQIVKDHPRRISSLGNLLQGLANRNSRSQLGKVRTKGIDLPLQVIQRLGGGNMDWSVCPADLMRQGIDIGHSGNYFLSA